MREKFPGFTRESYLFPLILWLFANNERFWQTGYLYIFEFTNTDSNLRVILNTKSDESVSHNGHSFLNHIAVIIHYPLVKLFRVTRVSDHIFSVFLLVECFGLTLTYTFFEFPFESFHVKN